MPTRKEKRDAKIGRMKRILEEIKEGKVMAFSEVYSLFNNSVSRRQVLFYLNELRLLGFIQYDIKTKTYRSILTGVRREFQSKADYELALKHSKQILTVVERDGIIIDKPEAEDLIPLILAELDPADVERTIKWRSFSPLIQHLRSGYNNSFQIPFKKLLEARRRMGDLGEVVDDRLGKLSLWVFKVFRNISARPLDIPAPPVIDESWEEMVKQETARRDEHLRAQLKEKFEQKLGREGLKELESSYNEAVGAIYRIINEVEHGIPLQGNCNTCPHLKITIKD